jgi:thioredoxin reductase (NADPH)
MRQLLSCWRGNSAGQALVLLANYGNIVNLVVRRPLAETISNHLIERIAALPNVDLCVGSEISELRGDKDKPIGVTWLGAYDAIRDRKGFVMTGDALELDALNGAGERLNHKPMLRQTSVAGVFANGDARARSVKRVATDVGKGQAARHAIARLSGGSRRERITSRQN